MPVCYCFEILPFLRCGYENMGIDRIKLRMKIARGHMKFPLPEHRMHVVDSGACEEKGKQHEVDHASPPLFRFQSLHGKAEIRHVMMTYR